MRAKGGLCAALAIALCMLVGVPALAAADASLFSYQVKGDGTVRIEKYLGEGIADIEVPAAIGGRTVSEIDGDAFVRMDFEPGDVASMVRTDIRRVAVPDTVTAIGEYAFYVNQGLTTVRLPQGLTRLDDGLFCACTALGSLEIPAGVTEIGDEAFCGCQALTSVAVPAAVRSIGASAFELCTSLENVQLPRGLGRISEAMFKDCAALRTVEIPAGVETIGEGAFSGCAGLESIRLPGSVRTIGEGAFSGCPQLRTVEYDGTMEQFRQIAIAGDAQTCALLSPATRIVAQAGPQPVPTPSPVPDGNVKLPAGVSLVANASVSLMGVDGTAYIEGYTCQATAACATVADLEAQFRLENGLRAEMSTALGGDKQDEYILATGDAYRVKRGDDTMFEATVVVAGDVLGRGTIGLGQLVRLASAYREAEPLEGPYLLAGDFGGDGRIDLVDLVREAALVRGAL